MNNNSNNNFTHDDDVDVHDDDDDDDDDDVHDDDCDDGDDGDDDEGDDGDYCDDFSFDDDAILAPQTRRAAIHTCFCRLQPPHASQGRPTFSQRRRTATSRWFRITSPQTQLASAKKMEGDTPCKFLFYRTELQFHVQLMNHLLAVVSPRCIGLLLVMVASRPAVCSSIAEPTSPRETSAAALRAHRNLSLTPCAAAAATLRLKMPSIGTMPLLLGICAASAPRSDARALRHAAPPCPQLPP